MSPSDFEASVGCSIDPMPGFPRLATSPMEFHGDQPLFGAVCSRAKVPRLRGLRQRGSAGRRRMVLRPAHRIRLPRHPGSAKEPKGHAPTPAATCAIPSDRRSPRTSRRPSSFSARTGTPPVSPAIQPTRPRFHQAFHTTGKERRAVIGSNGRRDLSVSSAGDQAGRAGRPVEGHRAGDPLESGGPAQEDHLPR
jgi:hypothetical protein